jgi:hypothetical protein
MEAPMELTAQLFLERLKEFGIEHNYQVFTPTNGSSWEVVARNHGGVWKREGSRHLLDGVDSLGPLVKAGVYFDAPTCLRYLGSLKKVYKLYVVGNDNLCSMGELQSCKTLVLKDSHGVTSLDGVREIQSLCLRDTGVESLGCSVQGSEITALYGTPLVDLGRAVFESITVDAHADHPEVGSKRLTFRQFRRQFSTLKSSLVHSSLDLAMETMMQAEYDWVYQLARARLEGRLPGKVRHKAKKR